jgi:hypothetical protein
VLPAKGERGGLVRTDGRELHEVREAGALRSLHESRLALDQPLVDGGEQQANLAQSEISRRIIV